MTVAFGKRSRFAFISANLRLTHLDILKNRAWDFRATPSTIHLKAVGGARRASDAFASLTTDNCATVWADGLTTSIAVPDVAAVGTKSVVTMIACLKVAFIAGLHITVWIIAFHAWEAFKALGFIAEVTYCKIFVDAIFAKALLARAASCQK
jgi:hypothetical protein